MKNIYNIPGYQSEKQNHKQKPLALKEKYGEIDEKYPELVQVNNTYFW